MLKKFRKIIYQFVGSEESVQISGLGNTNSSKIRESLTEAQKVLRISTLNSYIKV